MIPDALLACVRARLARVLAPPARTLVPLVIDAAVAGHLTPERADRVAAFADVFRRDGDALHLAPALHDFATRTEGMAYVVAQLAAAGALTAWRDERYAVGPALGAKPWFHLERAAARYFGVRTYAVHVNGLVQDGGAVRMWLARRSGTKAIDPGMLDNLVGGGVAAGASIAGTVVKEAWEEAGIPAQVAAAAHPAGVVGIFREQPDGIQHETLFVHDLWLPAQFEPANQDGEVAGHRQVDLVEAARLISLESGPDAVTADASLVVLDCLRRHAPRPGPTTMPRT